MRTPEQLSHHPSVERLARVMRSPEAARREKHLRQAFTDDGRLRADMLSGQLPSEHLPGGDGIETVGIVVATLTYGSISAQTCFAHTVTVDGARENDAVVLGMPSAWIANLSATGFVSADDTVSVRLCNPTTAGIVGGTFDCKVVVMR